MKLTASKASLLSVNPERRPKNKINDTELNERLEEMPIRFFKNINVEQKPFQSFGIDKHFCAANFNRNAILLFNLDVFEYSLLITTSSGLILKRFLRRQQADRKVPI